ncbi:MAG TPA: citrate/2-methylcitrate synthase [Gemmataceae bacterium]|nr:citrate/2-methylcitrate synthase [Gemmataceae bacterium]
MTPTPGYSPGLEGVIAGETAISSVEDGLRYRGYPVGELVEHCTFDEVAYLLLYGELPSAAQLRAFQSRVTAARRVPEPLTNLLKSLPAHVGGMDALRTSVSIFAHFDAEISSNSHDANLRKAERLLGQIPLAIADYYRFSKGLPPVPARQDLSHTANFLFMLRGTDPSPEETRALDLSLILYAEHEYNASTFSCRVVASTESDLHSCITAGIGALKGPLHGGANEVVLELLQKAGAHPQGPEAWIKEALARKEKIMGFGHRVYKTGDVRAGILKPHAAEALATIGQTELEQTAEVIEKVVAREKKLYPNLDWPAGRLYHALGLERTLYTPIFVMARVAGWSAHCIEQYDHNRLIRPRAKYTGPGKRTVAPLAHRK